MSNWSALELGQLCQKAVTQFVTTAEYETLTRALSLYLIHHEETPLRTVAQIIQHMEAEEKQAPDYVILQVEEVCSYNDDKVYYLLHTSVADLVKVYDPPLFKVKNRMKDYRASELYPRWIEKPRDIRYHLDRHTVLTIDHTELEFDVIDYVEKQVSADDLQKSQLLQAAEAYLETLD